MKWKYLVIFWFLAATAAGLLAEPFSYPRFTKVVGSMNWGKDFIYTDEGSRVEIRFVDGTVVHIEAKTKFRFVTGTREIILEQGTLFFSLPQNSQGVFLRAGNVVVSSQRGDFWVSKP